MEDNNLDSELMHKALFTPFDSLSQALKWMLETKESIIHKAVLDRQDIQTHIKNTKAEELISLAIEIDIYYFYDVVLIQEHVKKYLLNLEYEKLIEIFCSLEEILFYNTNYQLVHEKIKIYLSEDNLSEVLSIAKKVDSWMVWRLVLVRKDIDINEALFYAEQIDDYLTWSVVLAREDLDIKLRLNYLKRFNDINITGYVFSKLTTPLDIAFNFTEKNVINDWEKYIIYHEYIFYRTDIKKFFIRIMKDTQKRMKYLELIGTYRNWQLAYEKIIEVEDIVEFVDSKKIPFSFCKN